MTLSPRHGLSKDEHIFCVLVISLGNKTEAFRRAFPKRCVDKHEKELDPQKVAKLASQAAERNNIAKYLEWLQQDRRDLAIDVISDQMIMADRDQDRLSAANKYLDREEEEHKRVVMESWVNLVGKKARVIFPQEDGQVLEGKIVTQDGK